MIAKTRIDVKIDGLPYHIIAGEVIPPRVMEVWKSCNKIERLKSQGIIADYPVAKVEKKEDKK
jgi:hypothetical protein